MSKFWDWYDGLEATEPGFRFLLFIIMMLFCYLIIPAIIRTLHLDWCGGYGCACNIETIPLAKIT
jgi:hypothetical protein